ncbi:YueI family protein [Alkalicoccobacillus plakortidis]|uniref:YueI family protein n=1 Tax=Alkalicoccobacillus plakortidis TaxID=444060 RepID=A0ABT0XPR2_9BACI|nr:YueI family protein [Alkalicoccobacillus plakortidis]MCM2677797.1 YueI family protein [Alkalicoccobacillus plakortidis]
MKKVNDILEEAIYGKPEIRPQERKLFLSTILERVYVALTVKQVVSGSVYDQVSTIINTKKDLHLYINGHLSYQFYSRYTKLATKANVPFTIVTPTESIPVGLVLADAHHALSPAINSVFVEDTLYEKDMAAFNKD